MKNYNSAPLPFQGQKRNFIKQFKEALKHFPDDATFVDLFGGSGLLSHTIKVEKPNARVIYNDFDNYSERLRNIEATNKLIEDIKPIINVLDKKSKVSDLIKQQIIKRIEEENGFVDYQTLSSFFLFSGNFVTNLPDLKHQTFYNRMIQNTYSAEGYLQNVESVNSDYKVLLAKYKQVDNVIFILDPPYLSTDVSTYTNENYWKLRDYLNILIEIEGSKFIYFTSNKSQIVELCEWLKSYCHKSPFEGATTTNSTVNKVHHKSGYTDIMVIKK